MESKRLLAFLAVWGAVGVSVGLTAEPAEKPAPGDEPAPARLQAMLPQFPDADLNGDGVLSKSEAAAYMKKMRGGANVPAVPATQPVPTSRQAGKQGQPRPEDAVFQSDAFKITADELDKLMQADSAANSKEPLSFPKGNGLRILMTGHSWVAPARVTLPDIAAAAGYDGHHQRSHTNGGVRGSANSIFLTEIGKFTAAPPKPILLPAIKTGQWDVMTWGAFYGDTTEHFTQWIDPCLKYNPSMKFYIQDGWPTYQPSTDGKSGEEAIKIVDARRAELNVAFKQSYELLNAKYPAKVNIIPAGDAVVAMLHLYYQKKLPGFDTVSENLGGKRGIYRDGGHVSNSSGMAQLLGYVYYGTLYARSPELIKGYAPTKDVPEGLDPLLRKVAWQAVINNPLSGVTDKDGDGVGDSAGSH